MGRISKEEKQKKARNIRSDKWEQENAKKITLRFWNKSDSEVIKKINAASNKTDYIRQLILADIERESKKNG